MPAQKTKPSDFPQAVIKQIELLAQNIVIARKRRHETQAQWAKKLGVSQPTMARIERGDPAVAMASYVMCMWLINPACALADLVAPQSDHISLDREVTKARARRAPRAPAGPLPQESFAPAKRAQELGKSEAAKLGSLSGSSNSLMKLAQGLKISEAEKLGSLSGSSNSLMKLAQELGKSEAAARNVNVAAGLAALIAKAQGNAK